MKHLQHRHPLVLSIESATPCGSVALVSGAGTLGEIVLPSGRQMSETFLSAVDELLRSEGLEADAVSHVAVSAGPGSFTGLRVGMAAAKGFCFGWRIPVVPVSTLHALAWRFRASEATVCPILDARKGEIYTAAFRREAEDAFVRIAPDRAVAPEALRAMLPEGRILFCGDAVAPFSPFLREAFGERALPAEGEEALPRASAVGFLALERLRGGEEGAADPRSVLPSYLRMSEAERGLGRPRG